MSTFKDLPQEKREQLREMYETLLDNEDAYWSAPSQGFIADWFLLYWDLHNKCLEFMNQEPYDTPLEERKRYYEMKKDERG